MIGALTSLTLYRIKRILFYSILSFIVVFAITFLRNKNILPEGFNFNLILIFGISFGILLGILDDILLYSKLSRLSYSIRTLIKIIVIPLFIFLILYAIELLFSSNETFIQNNQNRVKLVQRIQENSILFNVYLTAFLVTFFNEINLILGDSFIFDYISGNIKGPTKENRIFMFVDLKNSTTIAEEIGDIHFFELLNDCYTILGISSIKYNAEIVKYVGDEAILTWKYKAGMKNNNCITIFQDFKFQLEEQKEYFIKKYGVAPRFTASAHAGSVITAYLGTIKRQQDYSGDVMNTTARIEGLNNQFNSEFLISEVLYNILDLPNAEKIESIPLKGKSEPINIFKIT